MDLFVAVWVDGNEKNEWNELRQLDGRFCCEGKRWLTENIHSFIITQNETLEPNDSVPIPCVS
jgi:hypothetical protein